MRKVCDWVFGSFFRTIGRVLVFVLIGIVISRLVDFGSLIDSFSITDLFFEKVNASGISGYGYFANAYKPDGTQLANGSFFADGIRVNIPDKDKHIMFNGDGQPNGSGLSISYGKQYKHVVFQIGLFSNSALAQVITSGAVYARYSRNNSFYANTICQFVGDLNADFDTDDITSQTSAVYYNLVCPIPEFYDSNINLSRLTISTASSTSTEFFEINRNVMYVLNDNYILQQGQQGITNAINNQSQQQQQQHNETQSYLEDTNTTQANTQGEDFINNFSNNSHGLTGIITAPLNAIQSIASATCSNLVLPLPFTNNKTLNLPCMSTIYTQHFGVFYTMYQGIILALISYWVCVRLFSLVKGFKDPEDDKIEVMDL